MLIIFAQSSWYIMAARFLIGVSGGGMFICIPGFVAEVADDQYVKKTPPSNAVLYHNLSF